VTVVEKASQEKKASENQQIAVSTKMVATNAQWVYSGGKTLIRKLPDELLVKIFNQLIIVFRFQMHRSENSIF
jgi:hypothetical protein